MRYLTAVLLLAASLPLAEASGASSECQRSCNRDYQLCLKRSTSKVARKTCTVMRKTCKYGCTGR
jgi:hypothetical protein